MAFIDYKYQTFFFNIFQVALIVFLSHIGSYVPADAATVGLTDRFFPFVYTQILKKMYEWKSIHGSYNNSGRKL